MGIKFSVFVFFQIVVFCMILRVNFEDTSYMFSGILVYHLPTADPAEYHSRRPHSPFVSLSRLGTRKRRALGTKDF